jgi:hypothetical protein
MKIHKQFINELIRQRNAGVSFLLGEKGLNIFQSGKNTLEMLDEIDSIIYTIEFLKKEDLIQVTNNSNTVVPNYAFFNELRSPDDVHHLHYTHEEFKKYYGMLLRVKPEIFRFKKRLYKTEKEIKDLKDLWLPIFIALLTAFFTAFFTAFLEKPINIFCG